MSSGLTRNIDRGSCEIPLNRKDGQRVRYRNASMVLPGCISLQLANSCDSLHDVVRFVMFQLLGSGRHTFTLPPGASEEK